ncbi:hypothetical protein [Saccharopolyspora phatthalungensis]|uniref:Uncharacterized protein n=1 Tax=Saccharopolyspora phatthalungensis TaxID=664693 RepID=A0A840Q0Q8_9PSEU|nr:hypothetical protein [Saccharopolyspora phatthalungensis]MBB5153111.1 hypothetical protein [Saccharopolyspora phatthalungensis]
MVVLGVVIGVAAVVLTAVWASRYYPARNPRNGAVSVRELVDRVESEASSGGWHQRRGPVTIRGDLADDLADTQTRILTLPPEIRSLDRDDQARNLLVLQRLLASVKRL